jgi:ABC-2 type transport system permease protein
MTAPITDAEVVVGKFLGALSFYAMLLVPTVVYVFVLWYYAEDPLDYGMIVAGYLGILLVGALYLSLGLLASSLTQNQILAAAVGFILCFIPVSFELLSGIQEIRIDPVLSDIVTYLTLWPHYRGFGRGFVDTRDICYFVSLTAFSLYLTTKVLESRRWL